MNNPKPITSRAWMLHAAGVGAVLLFTGAAGLLGVKPLQEAYATGASNARTLSERRRTRDEVHIQLRRLAGQLTTTRQTIEQGAVQLRPLAAVNERIARLADLAQEHTIRIEAMTPGTPEHRTHYDTMPIDLTGRATYKTFSTFLRDVNRTCPDIGIISFKLDALDNDADATAAFQVKLRWYAQPATP